MNTTYFKQPDNPVETLVWQYMPTDKFVKLIATQKLSLNKTEHFEDKQEGLPTRAEIEKHQAFRQTIHKDIETRDRYSPDYNYYQKYFFANCWHKNKDESYAMWKLYAGLTEGIAIQTTYKALSECYEPTSDKINLFIGEIRYLDTKKERENNISDVLDLSMRKDLPFSFENEVRIICSDFDSYFKDSIEIAINLEKLIGKIYVNPYVKSHADWYHKSIQFLIAEFAPENFKSFLLDRLQPSRLSNMK